MCVRKSGCKQWSAILNKLSLKGQCKRLRLQEGDENEGEKQMSIIKPSVRNLLPEHINHLFELFKVIGMTELLTLHSFTVDVLQSAVSYTWPSFPFLVYLILHQNLFSAWKYFPNVLHSTPNLEVLILDLEHMNDVDDKSNSHHRSPPGSVPNCLLQCLKKIGIKCVAGNEDELQIVSICWIMAAY